MSIIEIIGEEIKINAMCTISCDSPGAGQAVDRAAIIYVNTHDVFIYFIFNAPFALSSCVRLFCDLRAARIALRIR